MATNTTATIFATAWPRGVIARYLTIAGKALRDPNLAVDVTGGDHHTRYRRNGCGHGSGTW
ncbi:hypothetical protein [Streptomyces macrosporus]|uniref:Uncharacterized protein n=1 Tax=Streptomyces macrosporus TaxID=44032 RepID=A0ABN3KN27_9ACTN